MPPEVAVLVDNTGTLPEEQREMIAFVTEIHNGYPILAGDSRTTAASCVRRSAVTGVGKGGGQPFLQVFRFIHAAEGERLVGDHTRALVDLNTN